MYSVLLLLMLCCNGCSDSPSGDDNKDDTSPDSSAITVNIDTIHQLDTVKKESALRDVSAWKIADFIITEKFKSSEAVRRTVQSDVEEWKNLKSPLVAVYKGCNVGDYFHLVFEDSTGRSYDFGFGNNQFGEYDLCDKDINDNPKYLGKSFRIYWDWEISKFPCCDGEYDWVEAYMPSITKLELQ